MRTYRRYINIHRHIRIYKPNRFCYIYIYIYIYIHIPTFHLSYAQLGIHTWTPAQGSCCLIRVRTCMRAHIGRAAVHIEPRPSASATVRRRRPKAAHTPYNEVTDAVFHAPMFTLNSYAPLNACEPSHTRSAPAESGAHGSAQIRVYGK